ncbi:hypothetical protein PY254_04490 [Rhodanobacter sp. AS-Z3]|uniref:hypothetical protein n=1 Tax=Rhodanobacter sp. AS-Z3 TaxID=3031330 RepID=UPI00247AC994|nr:hypothetical protein [Rhodanobacter sp. AS-Z3]WEN15936.1 hypothetical protein PY254_04490 [Rhodanobacter sp. AS-Z3]
MRLWEITNDLIGQVSMLVVTEADRLNLHFWDQFSDDGSPMHWDQCPKLQPSVDKKRKKQKPRADISPFRPGCMVLNGKSRKALGDFLAQFGQLLEVDVLGEVEYYYNVTHIIASVDLDRSEVVPGGFVKTPAFNESAIPAQAVVFKDPAVRSSIYVNEAAKSELENRIAECGISGMAFKQIWGTTHDA